MNIFAISPDPKQCAQALDDRRLVKMVLETAQLLSAAARTQPHLAPAMTEAEQLYRATHLNHPVTLWVASSRSNFTWTRHLLEELLREYTHRYGKSHASERIARLLGPPDADPPPPHSWCNCTPNPDLSVFAAYRATLRQKWAADTCPPTWRNRGAPIWD